MLTCVYIENIAVIERAEISFSGGLNVITGETGAGKSIIIDAINMILGQRTSKDLIRSGSSRAFVSASFENIGAEAAAAAEALGFSLEDGVLILQRELHSSGKNVCRVNSRPATVSALRGIGSKLIAIHGQHESYELLSPDAHMDYLDGFAQNAELLKQYGAAYNALKDARSRLEASQNDDAARIRRIDLLRYQVEELSDAQLTEGEYEELTAERDMLVNSEKITDALMRAKMYISGEGDRAGAAELLENTAACVQEAARSFERLEALCSKLFDMYYELEDCAQSLEDAVQEVESDPERLEQIEERLDLIYRLSRKYGPTVSDMLKFLDKARAELSEIEHYDENREMLTSEYNNAKSRTDYLAQRLSEQRHKTARQFEKQVKAELAFLDMPNVEFTVSITQTALGPKGRDKVEFLISANCGEQPGPVSKIASGGELSRIMLAVKNVLSESETLTAMIFDEVDAGISGSAALKVGLKLKELSASRQVMCITHQAQIAALADAHFFIEKKVKDGRTFTNARRLDFEQRKHELARIIGGREITATALAHAQELLLQNGFRPENNL